MTDAKRSEWTRKLSRKQLEVIRKDTKDFEEQHPEQLQPHIYKDIDAELKSRDHKRGKE